MAAQIVAPGRETAQRRLLAQQLGEGWLDALDLAVEQAVTRALRQALDGVVLPAARGQPEPLTLLPLEEAGRRLGLERSSVEALLRNGVLTRVKLGRATRISSEELRAYQQQRLDEAGTELPGEEPTPLDRQRARRKSRPSAGRSKARSGGSRQQRSR